MTLALVDRAEVTRALRTFYEPGDVFELRILDPNGVKGAAVALFHWTADVDAPAVAAAELERYAGTLSTWLGAYFTLNPLDPAILARLARCRGRFVRGQGASDADVLRRRWLLVDVDANRPKVQDGVKDGKPRMVKASATEVEKAAGMAVRGRVRADVLSVGWSQPVEADSGNGAHGLWRVDLPAASDLPKAVLAELARRHKDDTAEVDQVVWNAARICKLYGTLTCKGPDLPDRPHRFARLESVPAPVGVVTEAQLRALLPAQVDNQAKPAPLPGNQAPSSPSATSAGANGERRTAESVDLDAAVAKYRRERTPGTWPKKKGTCPACGHNDCFHVHPENPEKWKCFGGHGADAPGCGRAKAVGYTGDVLDLDAFEAKRPGQSGRVAHLRAEGYLTEPAPGWTPKARTLPTDYRPGAPAGVDAFMEGAASTPSDLDDGGTECDDDGSAVEIFPCSDGGEYQRRTDGVFYVAPSGPKAETVPRPVLLCVPPVDVVAMVRDDTGGRWGRLVAWTDPDGVKRRVPMAAELLQGDGKEARAMLADGGVTVGPKRYAREQLIGYLGRRVTAKARCVDRVGWHGPVYLTPAGAIGPVGEEEYVFQGIGGVSAIVAELGTVDDWISNVAALAADNLRLMFAISVSFAGPLAALASEDSGGFHFRGSSSTGKTSALLVAASVYGPPAYMRRWRATANGLEATAVAHNDLILILDELSQCDPKDAGDAAYMLANSEGKQRMRSSGAARPPARWRLMLLSCGEKDLAEHMATGGRRPNAGQELRLATIPADAGAGMGIVEKLHGYTDSAAFVEAIKGAARSFHGAVGRAWLEHVVANRAEVTRQLERWIAEFLDVVDVPGTHGQARRVARRFALVAAAGEIATAAGFTGWNHGDTLTAAKACFQAWLAGFGEGSREELALINRVRLLLELHGSSRFEDLGSPFEQKTVNRLGYRKHGQFWVTPQTFVTEVCQGFGRADAVRVLTDAGLLVPGLREAAHIKKIHDKATRVYVLDLNDGSAEGCDEEATPAPRPPARPMFGAAKPTDHQPGATANVQ